MTLVYLSITCKIFGTGTQRHCKINVGCPQALQADTPVRGNETNKEVEKKNINKVQPNLRSKAKYM